MSRYFILSDVLALALLQVSAPALARLASAITIPDDASFSAFIHETNRFVDTENVVSPGATVTPVTLANSSDCIDSATDLEPPWVMI